MSPLISKTSGIPPDEFEQMDIPALEEETNKYLHKLEETRILRNLNQQEKEMIQTFYDIDHQENMLLDSKIKNLENEMEKMVDAHENQKRIFQHHIKNINSEHDKNLEDIAQDSQGNILKEKNFLVQRKEDLEKQKEELKKELEKQRKQHQQDITEQKERQIQEIQRLKSEFEKNQQILEQKFQKRLENLKTDLDLQRRMEIHEIEERKNIHINILMENYTTAFNDIKKYYNNMTEDNISFIKMLQTKEQDMKLKAERNQKTKIEFENANKNLAEPLKIAIAERDDLAKKLASYKKDKSSLKQSNAHVVILEKKMEELKVKSDELTLQYQNIEKERDTLKKCYEDILSDLHERSSLQNKFLEKHIEELLDRFNRKKAQFDNLVVNQNLDEKAIDIINETVEKEISEKNQRINDLKYDICTVGKAHNDLIRTFEAKLKEFGMSENERNLKQLINFDDQDQPIMSNTTPAGLI